ncbi:GNAT family N-acetyltransferase [Erythrobacter mangrovi]|uniref:GNAT family N-acetyltransferase n=1 Tax=Erythrobacter mangrovi TaxID=2739433 RepID=A0A7D3XJA2_9SPHN|nr:GNAT family protein [Erythrobacter mangrovi]QKG72538.1 GNAT family N-acetyltransferase [Erythrobacter mangrovi]
MIDDELHVRLEDANLKLVPLGEDHREGLRVACALDPDIWELYPFSYLDEAFDSQFDLMLSSGRSRRCYAILLDDRVVGMTAWIEHGMPGWSVEIGNSYITPNARGTGINRRFKKLMLDHAFACGFQRVAFKVDAINLRSRAAVLKLGCTQEGIMRHERRTWTGRLRDIVLFSILRDEWAG